MRRKQERPQTIPLPSPEGGVLRPSPVAGTDPAIEIPSLRIPNMRSIPPATVPGMASPPQDQEAGSNWESGGGISRFRCHLA